MNADDVQHADQGAAAGSGRSAVPSNAPAGLAEPAGELAGVAVSEGEGGMAAPDLPPKVVALIQREAFLFDAVGAPIARPPVDILCRLRFFHKVTVSLDEIVAVLRSGRSRRS